MSGKTQRYNIGLRGQSAALMDLLKQNGYEPKDVIFDALALYDFAIREIADGKQFGALSKDGNSMNTVITPILQDLKKNPDWLRNYVGEQEKASSKIEDEPSTALFATPDTDTKTEEAEA